MNPDAEPEEFVILPEMEILRIYIANIMLKEIQKAYDVRIFETLGNGKRRYSDIQSALNYKEGTFEVSEAERDFGHEKSDKRFLNPVFLTLAVLSAFYGVCVLGIHSGSSFYMVWFLLAAFFAALAVSGLFPVGIRRFLFVLLGIFAGVVAVTWGCVLTGFHSSEETKPDYILVLGAQIRGTRPSAVLRMRLDTAYDVLERNPETVCIVSGGQGANEAAPEGTVMRKYLIERGIPAERILSEEESENTVQNIVNSGAMINISKDTVGIVTNNFHVFRAVQIARKQGYRHVFGIAAPSTPFYLPNNMLRETCGIIKDVALGNM